MSKIWVEDPGKKYNFIRNISITQPGFTVQNFLLIFLLTFTGLFGCEVSICAIFQNEAPFLKEWINYHSLLGVERFYLFNDRSEDNFKEVLAPYIEEGIVELNDCCQSPGDTHFINQRRAYVRGLNRALGTCNYVAFIDIDEFIVPKNHDTIPEMLKGYPDDLGVMIKWRKFGTSGYWKLPKEKLLIEALIRCSPLEDEDNQVTKSIIQIDHLPKEFLDEDYVREHAIDLVHFQVWENYDGKKARRKGPITYNGKTLVLMQHEEAQINHYWCRNEEYYRQKKVPRKAHLLHEDFNRPLEWPEDQINKYLNEYNLCEDNSIQRFINPLIRACLLSNR